MGFKKKFVKVYPSNVYLVEIIKPIAYLAPEYYIQYASKGPGDRFYINKGSAGHKSIGVKSVNILAQRIWYHEDL